MLGKLPQNLAVQMFRPLQRPILVKRDRGLKELLGDLGRFFSGMPHAQTCSTTGDRWPHRQYVAFLEDRFVAICGNDVDAIDENQMHGFPRNAEAVDKVVYRIFRICNDLNGVILGVVRKELGERCEQFEGDLQGNIAQKQRYDRSINDREEPLDRFYSIAALKPTACVLAR